MTCILSKSVGESAIWVADWVLSCQQIRRPKRYAEIFTKFYDVFRGLQVTEDGFDIFLTVLEDVFDILYEGKLKGVIKAGTSVVGALGDHRIEIDKSFSELVGEAEEFFLCFLLFGLTLDAEMNPDKQFHGEHVYKILCEIASLEYYNKLDSDIEKPDDYQPRKIGFEDMRLKIMMNGFDTLPINNIYRFRVCMKILEFAVENDLFDKIHPYIYQIGDWFSEDTFVTPSDRRQVYSIIISQLKKKKKGENDLLLFLTKMVEDYDKELDISKKEGSVEVTVELLSCVMNSTDVVTFDNIINYQTVQQLKNTEHFALLELANIFMSGDHNDFIQFQNMYPDFFEKYGLDDTQCYQKIKLLVLASMASSCIIDSQSNRKIPLQELSQRFKLSLSETENLAIEAITRGIINGQIDQMNNELIIRSSLQISFGQNEWEKIGKRLVELDANIQEVLDYLECNDSKSLTLKL